MPQRLLPLGLSSLSLSARGLLTPALARLIAVSPLGNCEVRRRDTQCPEVLLLDCRQGTGELALGPYFDDHHRRKLGHHHEGGQLPRGLLVPPCQRRLRGLDVDAERSLYQTP